MLKTQFYISVIYPNFCGNTFSFFSTNPPTATHRTLYGARAALRPAAISPFLSPL